VKLDRDGAIILQRETKKRGATQSQLEAVLTGCQRRRRYKNFLEKCDTDPPSGVVPAPRQKTVEGAGIVDEPS